MSTYNAQEQDKIAIVKNWLGRKGLHYLENLTEGEKQACNTLQGLFDTLAAKFRPSLMRQLNHYSLGNCADSRVKCRRMDGEITHSSGRMYL